jgi:Na+-translocating ferredoxin:NAD+ oxidoreductase RnfE subunit
MSPIDALWHLLGLFLPALATGALVAGAAKGLWRTNLRGSAWSRLALWSASAGSLALLGGLVVFGRDGRMLSYAAMLAAAALALWWAGFVRPRR